MTRKFTLISLIVLTVLSSLFAIQSSNMLGHDLINKDVLFGPNSVIIASLPPTFLSVITVILFLGIIRVYLRPNSKKKLIRLYLILIGVFSFLGFVTAILSGAVVYKSFVKPYPFPGFVIIFMVVHLLILGASVLSFILLKKLPDDTEVFKVDVKHVFKTIGWFLFISMTYNRLGMLLAMPIYVQLRTLYLTFPFYLYLLVPVALGAYKVCDLLGYFGDKQSRVIYLGITLGVSVILLVAIVVLGLTHTESISAVSPAMPLERIASMPVEIIIQSLTYLGLGITLLVFALKKQEAE